MTDAFTVQALVSGHPFETSACEWIQNEWGARAGRTPAETLERLLDHKDCPPTQIASKGNTPIGLISFRRHPFPGRKVDPIWIDALYVLPKHRGQKIGVELVKMGERLSAAHEPSLFAYTNIPESYTRLGWTIAKEKDENGCWILERDLSQPASTITPTAE